MSLHGMKRGTAGGGDRRSRPGLRLCYHVWVTVGEGAEPVPVRQDQRARQQGTRFRIFPQPRFLSGFEAPETVWLTPPAGSIGAGPADSRIYAIDALDKRPYAPMQLPPYRGPVAPAARPDADGHFDHLDPDNRTFGAAHLYAGVRRVLDIWEGYLGRPIHWHFSPLREMLELIPFVDWDNAQAGLGFLETGFGRAMQSAAEPYCLNFDVIAHETGHLIVFSVLGVPEDPALTTEYLAFHESASDVVAFLSVLHFDSFIAHLLGTCHGNLYVTNELNRLAELSDTRQIRLASNPLRMRDVPDPRQPWQRLTFPERHRIGEPLTGAMFDILVEIFQELLVENSLISRAVADLATRTGDGQVPLEASQIEFDRAYERDPTGFAEALAEARDIVGERMAAVLDRLLPGDLTFRRVAATLLSVDRRLSGPRFQDVLRNALRWRQIGFGFRR